MKLSTLNTKRIIESFLLVLSREDFIAVNKLLDKLYKEVTSTNLINPDETGSITSLNKVKHEKLQELATFLNQLKNTIKYIKSMITSKEGSFVHEEISTQEVIKEFNNIFTAFSEINLIFNKYGSSVPYSVIQRINNILIKSKEYYNKLNKAVQPFSFKPFEHPQTSQKTEVKPQTQQETPKGEPFVAQKPPQRSIGDINKELIKYRKFMERPGVKRTKK